MERKLYWSVPFWNSGPVFMFHDPAGRYVIR
jgi:hypothetical protein